MFLVFVDTKEKTFFDQFSLLFSFKINVLFIYLEWSKVLPTKAARFEINFFGEIFRKMKLSISRNSREENINQK